MNMENKFEKLYLIDYNLLLVQDLWQVHCRMFLIILLNELIRLNVQTVIYVALNTQTLKMIS